MSFSSPIKKLALVIASVLLVIIAIIFIDQYITRSKLTDVILRSSAWKVKVYTHFKETQTLPTTCGTDTGVFKDLINPTPKVAHLRWCNTNNAIEITLNPDTLGDYFIDKKILLTAIIVDDFLRWKCSSNHQIKCRYLPANCQIDCD